MKSGILNLLEPSGPHRACYGTPVPCVCNKPTSGLHFIRQYLPWARHPDSRSQRNSPQSLAAVEQILHPILHYVPFLFPSVVSVVTCIRYCSLERRVTRVSCLPVFPKRLKCKRVLYTLDVEITCFDRLVPCAFASP
jgi:hypothetical protein